MQELNLETPSNCVKTGLKIVSRLGINSLGGAALAVLSCACPCGAPLMVCRTIGMSVLAWKLSDETEETVDDVVDTFCGLTDEVKELYYEVKESRG